MVTYQFQIDDETWREWKETVPRTKTLDARLVELIEADRDGRVLDADETAPTGREPVPGVIHAETPEPEPEPEQASAGVRDDAETVVDAVAAADVNPDSDRTGWADDAKLTDRKAAATAVLEYVATVDGHVSKGDAIDEFGDEYGVDGQSDDTWWVQTVRPALQAVGAHAAGKGYHVDPGELAERAAELRGEKQ